MKLRPLSKKQDKKKLKKKRLSVWRQLLKRKDLRLKKPKELDLKKRLN